MAPVQRLLHHAHTLAAAAPRLERYPVSLEVQASQHVAGLATEFPLVGDESVLEPQHWGPGADLWRTHKDCRTLGLSDEEGAALARRTLDQTLELLETNWHLVSSLAEEPLLRRRLWGWQVRRILRQAEREHRATAPGEGRMG